MIFILTSLVSPVHLLVQEVTALGWLFLCNLRIRQNFYSVKVIKTCNDLPMLAASASDVASFKHQLNQPQFVAILLPVFTL